MYPNRIKRIIKLLIEHGDDNRIIQMKKFAIGNNNMLGVSMPDIRKIAKQIGPNHETAINLWRTNIHEAKILASMLADPNQFTEENIDEWIFDFDAWDVCDQCCSNLFIHLPFIENKVFQYATHKQEFVKRFSFAMIANFAVHWKKKEDGYFLQFFAIIILQSTDSRNFVRKAVNWALRTIGKRSMVLNDAAITCCETLLASENKNAKWIAMDALKELTSTTKQDRLIVLEKRKAK